MSGENVWAVVSHESFVRTRLPRCGRLAGMEIDIEQLPIPDWNLACRKCGYPLKSLPQHRCPECGLEVVMSELVQPWMRLREPQFTGRELPLPDFGLVCGDCDAPLAGVTELHCPGCRAPFDPRDGAPTGKWYKIPPALLGELPPQAVEIILAEEFIPYVRRESRDLSRILGVDALADVRIEVPGEFYFDLLAALRRHELTAADPDDPDWTCSNCREPNPATFKICWNCHQPPNQG
ncbi:MAG: hypothetical protein IH895_01480 [Planctomycetes bacterium]|nr:hypothetical protein [Planctomycetota bacterium]